MRKVKNRNFERRDSMHTRKGAKGRKVLRRKGTNRHPL
jgi:hypothetical protein